MSGKDTNGNVLNVPFQTFAKSLLPLFCGPEVVIHIGSASHTYRLPKALLCSQSSYFAAMFNKAHFKEGAEQSTMLLEIDGVLSTQSFEMLVQWVCLGRVVFGDSSPADAIALSIEFARLVDMLKITGPEPLMAKHIKDVILADASRHSDRGYDGNNYSIIRKHIECATSLPSGHPVRGVLAMVMVGGFFRADEFRFQKEIQELPGFAMDILTAVKATLKSYSLSSYFEFKDPLSGKVFTIC